MVDTIIKVPIYNTKIKIVICEDLDKYCKENAIDERGVNHEAVVYDFVNYDRDFHFIVLFRPNVKSNTIVHECFHLTCGIMRYIGCKLSNNSEESFAYLNEYLYKVIQNIVLKNRIDSN